MPRMATAYLPHLLRRPLRLPAVCRPTAAAVLFGGLVALLSGCQQPWHMPRQGPAPCLAAAPARPGGGRTVPVEPVAEASGEPASGRTAPAVPGRLAHKPLAPDLEPSAIVQTVALQEVHEDPRLTLQDVVRSVYESYPLLEAALRERDIARGKELTAWGDFDTGLKAYSLAEPLGYYKRYRSAVKFDQPLWGGGSVFGGYKLGRGDFASAWYDDQTNRGGEFSLGVGVPLLQNRLIDKRRSGVSQAALARRAVEPSVQAQLLDFVREASQHYWYWVATGQALETQRELLRLAQERVQQIELRVQSGDLERIARIDNQRLIAARETKVIEAQRKLQMAAIKLSLFLRTPDGQPLLPDASLLPGGFPEPAPPDPDPMQREIQAALAARPELVELSLLVQQASVELAQAENLLWPKFDAVLEASQDVGEATIEKRTKSPFQLEAGVYGEVPLQRREARGKIEAARGKLAQLRAKRQFVEDKIAAQVQDAFSALEAAVGKIDRARTNLELSRQAQALGRQAFDAGDADLIVLNIYEQAVADAQLQWIDAQAEYFAAQADYRAALAIDPLATP